MYKTPKGSKPLRLNKIPTTLQAPIRIQRIYIGYLWLRSFTTSDRVYKKDLKEVKNKAYYWGKKLVSAGLIEDHGAFYRLKSIEKVWGQLGVKRAKTKTGEQYRFVKLDINHSNFLKDGITTYHQYLTRRKKRQIRNVLSCTGNSRRKRRELDQRTVHFSCISVSKTLGYSTTSVAIASKYRKVYFNEVPSIPVRRWIGSEENLYGGYRFDCGKINLKLD